MQYHNMPCMDLETLRRALESGAALASTLEQLDPRLLEAYVTTSLDGATYMRSVSAREANQNFSRLLQAVVEGEEVVITRRGKPVARLAPIEAVDEAERQAEIDRIVAHLGEGVDLGEPVSWTRDELYER